MNTKKEKSTILGLSAEEVAGLSLNEIVNNEVATKMLLHYYNQIARENESLKNDLNTLNTYVNAYNETKKGARIGTVLMAISNITVAFGVNLLTSNDYIPGTLLMLIGISLAGYGLFLAYFDGRGN